MDNESRKTAKRTEDTELDKVQAGAESKRREADLEKAEAERVKAEVALREAQADLEKRKEIMQRLDDAQSGDGDAYPTIAAGDRFERQGQDLLSSANPPNAVPLQVAVASPLAEEKPIPTEYTLNPPRGCHFFFKKAFLSSSGFVFDKVWPVFMLAFLINDLTVFCNEPASRYGRRLSDILFGLPLLFSRKRPTQAIVLNHLGSDIVEEVTPFFFDIITLTVLVVSLRVREFIQRTRLTRSVNLHELVEKLTYSSIFKDYLNWVFPFFERPEALADIKFIILWGNDQFHLINKITDLVDDHHGLARLYGMRALRDIAAHLNSEIDHPKRVGGYAPLLEEDKSAKSLRITALNKLNTIASGYSPASGYARYLMGSLFRMGKNRWDQKVEHLQLESNSFNRYSQFIYWMTELYIWYSTFRYLTLLVEKTREGIIYGMDKTACNDIFGLVKELGDVVCRICPDWNVYLKDTNDIQKCLVGFLSEPKSINDILKIEDRLRKHREYRSIDFSNQNLAVWSDDDFRDVLAMFQKSARELDTLDLSLNPQQPNDAFWWTDAKVQYLLDFISKVPVVKRIIIENQLFHTEIKKTLIAGLMQSSVQEGDFRGVFLDDVMSEFRQLNSSSFIRLNLNSANMSNAGLEILADGQQGSPLQEIDLGNNRFGSPAIEYYAGSLNKTGIKALAFGGNNFADADMGIVGQGIANSPVASAYLQSCGLMSTQMATFGAALTNATSLKLLDISRNPFHDIGLEIFLANLKNNTHPPELNLGYNALTQGSAQAIADFIDAYPIRELPLAGNNFGDGWDVILAAVQRNKFIKSIIVSDSDFGTPQLKFLNNKILLDGATTLKKIVMDRVNVDNQTAVEFVNLAAEAGVEEFSLAGNRLTDEVGLAVAKALPNSQFTAINLSQNPLSKNVMNQIIAATPGRNVKSLKLNDVLSAESEELIDPLPLIVPATETIKSLDDLVGLRDSGRDFLRDLGESKPSSGINILQVLRNFLRTEDVVRLAQIFPYTNIDPKGIGRVDTALVNTKIVNPVSFRLLTEPGSNNGFFNRPGYQINNRNNDVAQGIGDDLSIATSVIFFFLIARCFSKNISGCCSYARTRFFGGQDNDGNAPPNSSSINSRQKTNSVSRSKS